MHFSSFVVALVLLSNSAFASWWDEPVPDDIATAAKLFKVPREAIERALAETPHLKKKEAVQKGKELGQAFLREMKMISTLKAALSKPDVSAEDQKDLENEIAISKSRGREILLSTFAYGRNMDTIKPITEWRIAMWGPVGVGYLGKLAYDFHLIPDFKVALFAMVSGLGTGVTYLVATDIMKVMDPMNARNALFGSFLDTVQAEKKVSFWHPMRSLCQHLLEP